MKFTYRNSETTTIEIEAADEIAITLETSYREEANGNRRYRAHTYSMDAALYEGIEYAAPDTPESILVEAETQTESSIRYTQALSLLTDMQRTRFLMFAAGMSTHEIAHREGVNQKSVHESIEAARKKLKKFYQHTPSI